MSCGKSLLLGLSSVEVFQHHCWQLDQLKEWLVSSKAFDHPSTRSFLKKIDALEFVGVDGNSFVFVELVVEPALRLVKFKLVDPITILEVLHSAPMG